MLTMSNGAIGIASQVISMLAVASVQDSDWSSESTDSHNELLSNAIRILERICHIQHVIVNICVALMSKRLATEKMQARQKQARQK